MSKLTKKVALVTGGSRGMEPQSQNALAAGWSTGGHHLCERRRGCFVGRQSD